ncbi:hypothetical protein PG999_003331 [Apiospora kogelbergensis]|uniref:AAA domain-containing protein n=1 Tax=Apiospora kogelbergensis TaxID=1337665 RepID=A0AAW0R376_9PEZI
MPSHAVPPSPIIHINGFPGVGKLTVARALRAFSGPTICPPACAILKRTEEGYQSLRRALRAAVFEPLAENPTTYEHSYIFTDNQSTDLVGASVCAEYAEVARRRGVSWFRWCCRAMRRPTYSVWDRRSGWRAALFRDKTVIHRFNKEDAVGRTLEVDVTRLSPEESATIIFRYVLESCPELEKIVGSKS